MIGYIGLFQGSDENAVDTFWKEPGGLEALSALANNPEAPPLASFLAVEILFCKQEKYPPAEQKARLASLYATAFAQNFTGVANTWGMPNVLVGLVAEHLIAPGEIALPELVNLLDEDWRVYYKGSKEATLGHPYRYKVKDLAACYIGKIRNIRVKMDEEPSKRNEAIEKLKRAIR